MINQPPLKELLEKVEDCRYTLVVTISKRARQIMDDTELMKESTKKPVTMAVNELISGELFVKKP